MCVKVHKKGEVMDTKDKTIEYLLKRVAYLEANKHIEDEPLFHYVTNKDCANAIMSEHGFKGYNRMPDNRDYVITLSMAPKY